MNVKLLFKTCFLILIFLMLVLMGLNNRGTVQFALPPVLPKAVTQPAAIMYFAFFAVGLLTGTILTAGSSKKSNNNSNGNSSKSGKSEK